MTLTEFLAARLDEDEATARRAAGGSPASSGFDVDVFVGRHNPARALREVTAKRRIVSEHAIEPGLLPPSCLRCHDGHDPDSEEITQTIWPCLTVRIMAAVYSDHPDYRPEWA